MSLLTFVASRLSGLKQKSISTRAKLITCRTGKMPVLRANFYPNIFAYLLKGGLVSYEKAKKTLKNGLKKEKYKDVRLATMFYLYALPNEFPQFEQAKQISDPYKRVEQLEIAFANEIEDDRFIPYIQLHEFEALILTEPNLLIERFPEHQKNVEQLSQFCQQYSSPELINDGATTAPSKQIIKRIPSYEGAKVSVAPLMTQKIGLETIRSKCPHFHEWLIKLENLNTVTTNN